jgi:hypothetical protein
LLLTLLAEQADDRAEYDASLGQVVPPLSNLASITSTNFFHA